jgi:hypothetical protein
VVTLLLTVLDVARKTEIRNTYKTFVEIPEVKEHHETFCRRRADNIKMDLKRIVCENVNWTYLAEFTE